MFFVILFPICCTMLFVTEHLRGGVCVAVVVHAAWNASDALMPDHGDLGVAVQTAIAVVVACGAAFAWRTQERRR